MFNPTSAPINDIGIMFGNMSNLVNQSAYSLEQSIQALQNDAAANGGMLSPLQLANLQMYVQTYTSLVTSWSSIIKQVGDLDRSIASNIGS